MAFEEVLEHSDLPYHANPHCIIPRAAVASHLEDGNIPPFPKKKPVLDLKKDLRPNSLTPCVSKVAEEFVVEDVVKPAVLDVIHGNQYGAIQNSSTTMALISMLYAWSLGTDGNGATVRTMLFDYRMAFDFID